MMMHAILLLSTFVFTIHADVNWVTQGKVTAVKDQGQCGARRRMLDLPRRLIGWDFMPELGWDFLSEEPEEPDQLDGWAFASIAAVESWAAISTDTTPPTFSEQQLIDCSGSYGNQGCNGGTPDQAFAYMKANGLCTEASYKYKGRDQTCRASHCTKASFSVSGYTDIRPSTSAIKSALDKGPVVATVDAENWQSYAGGIFRNCGTSRDHAVLVVGYTSTYWLVKNSWGSSWGENGYIRLAMGNTCGIADEASYPSVE